MQQEKLFQEMGLNFVIKINLKVVDFLNVKLNLIYFLPLRKLNSVFFVNLGSNHAKKSTETIEVEHR